jgi:hypothetical protein
MSYFQLRCETCDVTYKPLVSTDPEELSDPDEEILKGQVGDLSAESFLAFRRLHAGHVLVEAEIMERVK